MSEDPELRSPAPRVIVAPTNRWYMAALVVLSGFEGYGAIDRYASKDDVKNQNIELRAIGSKVAEQTTATALLQAQGAQTVQALTDIRAQLAPLSDGERERLKIEKVVRDLVKDEALKK